MAHGCKIIHGQPVLSDHVVAPPRRRPTESRRAVRPRRSLPCRAQEIQFMTLPWTTVYGPRRTGPRPLRLSLRDPAAPTGPVDGAWWPRSKQPAAELHELVAAVAARLGSMVRVGFD
ncbi:DUF5994 family protein [Nocardia yamanashiensis]|uniref:DUF5994 family protein n=1 Tax=Nocardia yamanashiensis TaxID=209247 RepID=UPI00350E48B1